MLELDHFLDVGAEELARCVGGEAQVVLREVETPVKDNGPVHAAGLVLDQILARGNLELEDVPHVVELGLRFECSFLFFLCKI